MRVAETNGLILLMERCCLSKIKAVACAECHSPIIFTFPPVRVTLYARETKIDCALGIVLFACMLCVNRQQPISFFKWNDLTNLRLFIERKMNFVSTSGELSHGCSVFLLKRADATYSQPSEGAAGMCSGRNDQLQKLKSAKLLACAGIKTWAPAAISEQFCARLCKKRSFCCSARINLRYKTVSGRRHTFYTLYVFRRGTHHPLLQKTRGCKFHLNWD